MEDKQAQFEIEGNTLFIKGYWQSYNLNAIASLAEKIKQQNLKNITQIDGSLLKAFDTNSAWILITVFRKANTHDTPALVNVPPKRLALWQRLNGLEGLSQKELPKKNLPTQLVVYLGQFIFSILHEIYDIIVFTGQLFTTFARLIRHPRRIRLSEISAQILKSGLQATMIVSLIAFSIALVIGFLMIAPLRTYGVQDMTVSLVSIGILQEMGVLLTAIMVAGRTGSAFAAELGVMNVNEETDALESLGMDPFEVLVVPRIIGVIISLCLLTIIADIAGLIADFFIAFFMLDNGWTTFIRTIFSQNLVKDFFMGFSRAPVYGLVIGVIGCMRGLQVKNSAQEVGTQTTAAVVQSIFLVIFLHAGFALLFQLLGIR